LPDSGFHLGRNA